MIFNSQEFLIFLVVVLSLFYALPHKFRWLFILLSSYFFYGWWNPYYLILIFFSTLTDYLAGIRIHRSTQEISRKTWLIISLLVNFGILFSFKYANFFAEIFNLTTHQDKFLDVLLPVGVSFYTFQTVSYTIDVYRKRLQPETKIINFSLYVVFFPQLVAGPIERAENILPQFRQRINFEAQNISQGLTLVVLGFFQKVVIADNLAPYVDILYDNPENYHGLGVVAVVILFAFQLYNDFAGYTNIARGVALMLGIKLSINFRQPFFAYSIQDFWQRWHISLSTWFRDYVYIPLGGKKVKVSKWIFIVIITFSLSGLWHGANYTFVLWGFLNAIIYVLERLVGIRRKSKNKIIATLQIASTFIIFSLLLVIFRSQTIEQAIYIIKNIFVLDFKIPFDHKWILFCFVLIFINIIIEFIDNKNKIELWLEKKSDSVYIGVIYTLLMMIIFLGNWHSTPFIYFQF